MNKLMKNFSIKRITSAFITVMIGFFTVLPANALTLSYLDSFSTGTDGGGAGIAFVDGKLYVSNGSNVGNSTIREFSFDVNNIGASAEIRSFTAATNQDGLHGFTTNLLMSRSSASSDTDRLLEISLGVTTLGVPVGGGTDLLIDQINDSGTNSLEAKGVTVGPNGNFLVADEANNRILELNSSGVIVSQLDMTTLMGSGFISDLEGIAYYSDNKLFAVTDSNGGTGASTVYELDISSGLGAASFVASTFLGANDGSFGNLDDPEGLAIDLANNLLFVSDNAGNEVGVYRISTAVVPVPGALILFGSALLGLFGASRRKQVVVA